MSIRIIKEKAREKGKEKEKEGGRGRGGESVREKKEIESLIIKKDLVPAVSRLKVT